MERADMTWEDKQMAIVNIAYILIYMYIIHYIQYGNVAMEMIL